jgi:hypothetical protein
MNTARFKTFWPCAFILTLLWGSAHAGRPLSVDDANVNELGKGHIETWLARGPSGQSAWFVSPAWSPKEGLELAATVTRDRLEKQTAGAVQAKFRLSASQENGCNFGALVGLAQAEGEKSNPYVNGLLSCNHPDWGSVHGNLGAVQSPGSRYNNTWGVAWEYPIGEVTFHVESFGQQHLKPTRAMGLRYELSPSLQVDGSVGRQIGKNLLTLGVKWMF